MSKLKYIFVPLSFLIAPVSNFFAQNTDTLSIYKYEQLLSEMFSNVYSISSNDSQKERINNEIIKNFEYVLTIRRSFVYSFDSLKNIGKILSPDNRLRLYTWNIPHSDGTHKYFGFIQYYPEKGKEFVIYKLIDKKDSYESPEEKILGDTNWFGALYYEIIEAKHQGTTFYTLLGFDFNNLLTSKKIVEVLYFEDDSIPVFGKPIFNYQNNLYNRIIFEYSSKVSMSLKYNKDLKMIIFDHLSPSKPSYKGHFIYYGPDFSYDGLEFKDGTWNEIHDVDVRNPAY